MAAAVSLDEAWLEETLAAAARADDFTARLLRVLRDTRECREGSKDEVVLLLSRSDYLLDKPSSKLLQVELNTIASSFGCLGDAALCPSVALQLAGAKKVQQALAAPGATERFLVDPIPSQIVRAHFAGLWGLDGAVPEEAAAADEALKEALAHPE